MTAQELSLPGAGAKDTDGQAGVERGADWAEDYAFTAIDVALAAIREAEWTVLDSALRCQEAGVLLRKD